MVRRRRDSLLARLRHQHISLLQLHLRQQRGGRCRCLVPVAASVLNGSSSSSSAASAVSSPLHSECLPQRRSALPRSRRE